MASQDNMAVWRACIREWYPDYETKTYFAPPVVITRTPFDEVTLAGRSALAPQFNPTQAGAVEPSFQHANFVHIEDSDTRGDLSLQRVLLSLLELFNEQREPMFVISQLPFSSYLGEPCYAAAAKQFLQPQNLSQHDRQGDFDILVIHRHYGIIIGEIKSVLSNQQQLQSSQSDVDRLVTDGVKNAIEQLNKSEVVLREITKDLEPNLAIRKLLIFPYVTADILTRVVSSDEQLKQDLVTCLQAEDFDQALQYCLLASSSETETANNQQPNTWRSIFNVFESDRSHKSMTTELYLDLLARFCGPATTVSIYFPTTPREGQGVAFTGDKMTSLVLTPEQINLLTRAPTKVLLTGPKGVGKSVMLALMALTWLRQGHDVRVICVDIGSVEATDTIQHTIQLSLRNDPTTPSVKGKVYPMFYDFYNSESHVNEAIDTLTAASERHGPYVICDDVSFEGTFDEQYPRALSDISRYQRFVRDLCRRLPSVSLWVASPCQDQRPRELQEEKMTIPLKCLPC